MWITKYRRKILRGEIAERVREIVREECRKARVEILRGHISTDHVHVMVSIPPQVTISRLIQRMKGKRLPICFSTNFPRYGSAIGDATWGHRGYFCRSSGNVTDEVIKAYIERQDHSTDDVFRIEGESSRQGTRH